MAKFMLLLSGGDFTKFTPEEQNKIVERYMAWSEKLRKSGHHRAGDELKGGGRLLSVQNQKIVDGPFTETKEAIGGYYMIEAESMDEAVEVAKECPHLTFNGVVQVREVNPH